MLKFERNKKVVIPGVPPRDLSEDDIKKIAKSEGLTVAKAKKQLVETGLYSETKKGKK